MPNCTRARTAIAEVVRQTPVIDHHVHGMRRTATPAQAGLIRQIFTESPHPEIWDRHVPHLVAYRWGLRELNRFWSTPEGEDAGEEGLRARVAAMPFRDYAATLVADAGIRALLIDTGFQPDLFQPPEEMAAYLPCDVRAVLRLETEAARLLPACRSAADLADAVKARVREERAREGGIVGLKSVIAYRSGLRVEPPRRFAAEEAFRKERERDARSPRADLPRLSEKDLLDLLVWSAAEVAAELGLPIQFHVGHGDPDTDLRLGNPLHLRALLEEPRFRDVPVVLLHNYPFVGEAAYLAHVYPNVYGDLSLAIPQAGALAPRLVYEFLGLGPWSKLLFASDAHSLPEFHWLGTRLWRRALEEALSRLVEEDYLSEGDAVEAAARILAGNAERVYPLG